MSELFIKLLNMSISASWLVLFVVILRLALKKAPRWIACVLWAMVAVRLLCPFSIESVLSLVPSAETVPEEIIYSESPEIESGIPIVNSTVNPIISESLAPDTEDKVNPMVVITGVSSVVWVAGIAAMAGYGFISYFRIRKRVSEAVEEEKGIYICDRVNEPFILGLFAPRIILPSNLGGEDREYVVSHEKAHLQRMDHIWKPLGFVLLSVYWFNPVLWIGYILLCRDIEAACDEKVIKQLGEGAKKSYAEALINCSVPKRMISACPLAFGEAGVKERVRNVLNYKKPAFWIIIVAVIACIATGIFFLTDPKKEKKPEKEDDAVVDTTGKDNTTQVIEKQLSVPRYGVFVQIVRDYHDYRFIEDYRNGVGSITYYIEKYYGNYDGAIPVIIKGSELIYKGVYLMETIAGCTFAYPEGCIIHVWENGTFYTLSEAYEKGILSKDEIRQICEVEPLVFGEEDYSFSTSKGPTDKDSEEAFKRVKSALTELDSATIEKISEIQGYMLDMLDCDEFKSGVWLSHKDRCYGIFGDCIVMYGEGMTQAERTIRVANSTFRHNCGFSIMVYYNNEEYTINEAYEKGLISAEDIEIVAENHAIVDAYLWKIGHE